MRENLRIISEAHTIRLPRARTSTSDNGSDLTERRHDTSPNPHPHTRTEPARSSLSSPDAMFQSRPHLERYTQRDRPMDIHHTHIISAPIFSGSGWFWSPWTTPERMTMTTTIKPNPSISSRSPSGQTRSIRTYVWPRASHLGGRLRRASRHRSSSLVCEG